MLPAARASPVDQRCHARTRGVDAGDVVREGDAHAHGAFAGIADNRSRARFGVDGRPVGYAVAHRPGESVSGHRDHHDPRVAGAQGLEIDAEVAHHARAEVLDDQVAPFGKGEEGVASARRRQVDGDALLVPVEFVEEAVAVPVLGGAAIRAERAAAAGVFDLDHLGAEVREHARRHRPGPDAREVEHADARERRAHAPGWRRGGYAAGCRERLEHRLVSAEDRGSDGLVPAAADAEGQPGQLQRTPARVLGGTPELPRLELLVAQHFVDFEDGRAGDAERLALLDHLIARAGGEPRRDGGIERREVLRECGKGGKARVADELGVLGKQEELLELCLAAGRERRHTVGAVVEVDPDQRGVAVAGSLQGAFLVGVAGEGELVAREQALHR